MAAKLKIQVVSDSYFNEAQETLISSLELAFIEDPNFDDGRVVHHTGCW